jgi:phytoene dehydrogenase-like protein
MTTAVVIGAGHNGLAAAFYLAKAGVRTTVFEARKIVGGGAVTEQIHPGFRGPTLSHHVSLRSDVARDMDLSRHGVQFLTSPVDVFAPDINGRPLVVYSDVARTGQSLHARNAHDGESYVAYRAAMDQVSSVIASLLSVPAPRIGNPDVRDLLGLLGAGRRFRALDRRNAYRLLRWLPMPVADLTREWFESELLCAAIAAGGLSGTMLGPRSAGSGLVLLLREANRRLAGTSGQVRGGPGALTAAMAAAAREAGAEVQTDAHIERIVIDHERASGVVINGREVAADAVISAIDPKTTFLRLVDPINLMPDFLMKMRNYRAAGTVAKVNLALHRLPAFEPAEAAPHDHGEPAESLSGRIHIGPDLDYLERAFDCAKYGELSAEPWLEVMIPSVLDASLAPSGAHVMSIYAHYAPYQLRNQDWPSLKDTLLSRVLATLEPFAPGIRSLVVAASVITPQELDTQYGFYGGHIFHGELALDQLASMRPLLRYARYSTPIRGLFLCSAGTHPGGFMAGASGKMAAREVVRALASRHILASHPPLSR